MPAWQHRVTRGDDYRRIVRTGSRVGGAFCITHAVLRSADAPTRFGFIISKAVGNAVTRNRIRRRMKTIAELHLAQADAGFDIVFRALPKSAEATYAELEAELTRAIGRVCLKAAK